MLVAYSQVAKGLFLFDDCNEIPWCYGYIHIQLFVRVVCARFQITWSRIALLKEQSQLYYRLPIYSHMYHHHVIIHEWKLSK